VGDDALANWIEDRCELIPGVRSPAKALYEDYVAYCGEAGEEPLSQRTFATQLTDRGCGEARTGAMRFRTGIRVKDPTTPHQAGLENDPGDTDDVSDASDANFRNSSPDNLSRTLLETNVTNVIASSVEVDPTDWEDAPLWELPPSDEEDPWTR